MPDISKITLPSGTTYDIKDATARQLIADLENYSGYLGVTTTALVDGVTTSAVIVVNGGNVTAKSGDIAIYGKKEFIYSGSVWQEFGDMSALGSLAYKNSASASYTPAGSVSQPTFTGTASDVSITAEASSSGNYTPAGSVSQPTFSGSEMTASGKITPEGSVTVTTDATTNKTATVSKAASGTVTYTPEGTCAGANVTLNTTTVNSITAVGTLPSLTTTVADETLTIGWSAGTLPTKGSNQSVATSVKEVTQPTFTGTGARLVTGNIAVPNTYKATFTGTEADISVSGTPTGTVSKPTFSGTKVNISGSVTPSGTVSKPTFTGTGATITSS